MKKPTPEQRAILDDCAMKAHQEFVPHMEAFWNEIMARIAADYGQRYASLTGLEEMEANASTGILQGLMNTLARCYAQQLIEQGIPPLGIVVGALSVATEAEIPEHVIAACLNAHQEPGGYDHGKDRRN